MKRKGNAQSVVFAFKSLEGVLHRWGFDVPHDNIDKHIPVRQLVDPLDQRLGASAKGEVPMDQHLRICVQMAQEVSSAFPTSTSLHYHF